MFEKNEKSKLNDLKAEATSGKKVIERPVSKQAPVIKESVESQIAQVEPDNKQDGHLFNNYMGELKKW